jgi:uncharacterized protein (TIGR04255 family)
MPPTARRSIMLPDLPTPDERLLDRPPLEIVICEIRVLTDTPAVLAGAEGLRLKETATSAGFEVDRIEPIQQQAFTMSAVPGTDTSPLIEKRTGGWKLTSDDGNTIATVWPDVVNVQTTRYVSWEGTFRPLLTGALTAFADVIRPEIRQRIGLRYVDRLVDPNASAPIAWRGRVVDSLLGLIADPSLGERVINSQQQVDLAIGDNRQALLRHGPFADGAMHGAISYMIDIDVFDTATTAFDIKDALHVTDELNKQALSLFQTALSESYLATLRGNP